MERGGWGVWVVVLGVMAVSSAWFVVDGARSGNPMMKMGENKEMLGEERPVLSQAMVDAINSPSGAGWTAGFNERLSGLSVRDFRTLCGARKLTGSLRANEEDKDRRGANGLRQPGHLDPDRLGHRSGHVLPAAADIDLPASFDAREAWPHCHSVSHILDQGHCGSCWAFGAVESLSDRFCIVFNDTRELSENDLLSCCGFFCGDGCNGGYPIYAWEYFKTTGVVTTTCDPYFDGIGCKHPGCEPVYPTPRCVTECVDQDESWESAKRFVSDVYIVGPAPEAIMREIYQHGPVEVSFTVYEDFAHYKSGVYVHITGEDIGGHAVKLIGWGAEGGVDYWLCVNSWNRSWGEDGYFKIRRGTNECGIEEEVVAGTPSLIKVDDQPFYRRADA